MITVLITLLELSRTLIASLDYYIWKLAFPVELSNE
jgi:hypothetical protein